MGGAASTFFHAKLGGSKSAACAGAGKPCENGAVNTVAETSASSEPCTENSEVPVQPEPQQEASNQ